MTTLIKHEKMDHYKFLLIASLTSMLIISTCSQLHAQCNAVSGMSGFVHNSASTDSVSYTVTVTTGASFMNLGTANACGFSFPGIQAPWCGNTNIIDTVTYTFSSAITSIDVIVAYVGVLGSIHQETFDFITNGSTPAITVDSGSCAAWIVEGTQITSPPLPDGLNAVVTVSSAIPFTTLGVIGGTGSSTNGGASYGLCDASLLTSVRNLPFEKNVHVFPNPVDDELTISLEGDNQYYSVKLVNLLRHVVAEKNDIHSKWCTMDVSALSHGIYIAELNINGNTICTRICKE